MAALVLTGIVIGADKLNQKRKQRKAEKAAQALTEPPVYEEHRLSTAQSATRSMPRNGRTSENAQTSKEIEAQGERRRSSSEEREMPPAYENAPTYHEVVRESDSVADGMRRY